MGVDNEELSFLINQGEGYNLEFKESFSKNIAKDICAFANASGGRILVGVSDEGEIKGAKITNNLKSEVHTLVRNFDPPLNVEIEAVGGILVISVPESISKPHSTNGKFYLRYGTNSQQLARSEIREFFQKEGLVLFDEKLNCDFDIKKDFSTEAFNRFLEVSKISPVMEKEAILENSFLLKSGCMKNAGVLLFCHRIAKFFPQATITCVLYLGKTKYKILDRKEFDADLYSNFHDALVYVQSRLNTEFIIKGGPREERLELPEEALREALLNAIAHRDYFTTGAGILVEIFSDRVEMTNPGGLVKGLTQKDLGKKSLSRNNLLFGLLQRMGLVEKVGSGITRMRKAMKDYGLGGPDFDISENWFTIVFGRPVTSAMKTTQKTTLKLPENYPETARKIVGYIELAGKGEEAAEEWYEKWYEKWYGYGLSEREIEILTEIKRDSKVSIKRLSDILGIYPSAIQKHVGKLKERGVLRRVGPAKGGRWEVIEK